MLRQALDAAEKQEAETARAAAAADSDAQPLFAAGETTSLVADDALLAGTASSSAQRDAYGSVSKSGAKQRNRQADEQAEDDDEGNNDSDDGGGESSADDWDDDEEEDYDEEDEEEKEEEKPPFLIRLWNGIKSFVVIVANVENLWDDAQPDQGSPQQEQSTIRQFRRRRNAIVLFWFVVLASSYAAERSTFKLLVDRTGPFRLFSVEVVTATHCVLLLTGWFVAFLMKQNSSISLGISIIDVGLMALLDTLAMMLAFLAGVHVPPTLTVILVQFTLPLTAFLTQFVHPDGRCSCTRPREGEDREGGNQVEEVENGDLMGMSTSNTETNYGGDGRDSPSRYIGDGREASYLNGDRRAQPSTADEVPHRVEEGQPLPRAGGLSAEHVWGSLIIFLAVLLALLPAFYSIADPDFFIYADTIPLRTAYNTLLYVSSCVPAAASQLYKEHVFLQYKQPVNATYLNILLSLFQFIFASIVSPLIFTLQGLGGSGSDDWTKLYPASKFSENFLDGLYCYLRILSDDDQENKYYDDARCDFVLGLVIFHTISIITIGIAVDKIVNAGTTKLLYRGMSAGIIVAVLCMHAYDMHIPDFGYGPVIDGLNLACLILLILGSEVYHRVGLKESTFETTYPILETFYDE